MESKALALACFATLDVVGDNIFESVDVDRFELFQAAISSCSDAITIAGLIVSNISDAFNDASKFAVYLRWIRIDSIERTVCYCQGEIRLAIPLSLSQLVQPRISLTALVTARLLSSTGFPSRMSATDLARSFSKSMLSSSMVISSSASVTSN